MYKYANGVSSLVVDRDQRINFPANTAYVQGYFRNQVKLNRYDYSSPLFTHTVNLVENYRAYRNDRIPSAFNLSGINPEYIISASPELGYLPYKDYGNAFQGASALTSMYGEGRSCEFYFTTANLGSNPAATYLKYSVLDSLSSEVASVIVAGDDRKVITLTSSPEEFTVYHVQIGGFVDDRELFNDIVPSYQMVEEDEYLTMPYSNYGTILSALILKPYETPTIAISGYIGTDYANHPSYVFYPVFGSIGNSIVNVLTDDLTAHWRVLDRNSVQLASAISYDDGMVTFPHSALSGGMYPYSIQLSSLMFKRIENDNDLYLNYPSVLDTLTAASGFNPVVADIEFYGTAGVFLGTDSTNVSAIYPASANTRGVLEFSLDDLFSIDYSASSAWKFNNSSVGSPPSLDYTAMVGLPPYHVSDYVVSSNSVSLNLTKEDPNGYSLDRKKTITIMPPTPPIWHIFPETDTVKTSSTFVVYNLSHASIPNIPLTAFDYYIAELGQFERITSLNPMNDNFQIETTFNTPGYKAISVSAYDANGFIHENTFNNFVLVSDDWNGQNYALLETEVDEATLPHDFDDVRVKPNEFTDYNNINASIEKLYNNLLYLDDISGFYKMIPSDYLGWFGGYAPQKWYLGQTNPDTFDKIGVNPNSDYVACINLDNDHFAVASKTKIEIFMNNYESTLVETISERSYNDYYKNIKAIGTYSYNGKIYVMVFDSYGFGMVSLHSFIPSNAGPNMLLLLSSWGGFGGRASSNKFKKAVDFNSNDSGTSIVADQGNGVVKIYTHGGGWLHTIEDLNITDNAQAGKILSASISKEGQICVLTEKMVFIYDSTYNLTRSFLLEDKAFGVVPVCVRSSEDIGLFYVVCKDRILKFTENGYLVGSFGNNERLFTIPAVTMPDGTTADYEYTNIVANPNRTAFVVANRFIYKVIDYVDYIKLKSPTSHLWWPLAKLEIAKNEFSEYWVYNKMFNRMYDDIEYYRKALFGKMVRYINEYGELAHKVVMRNLKLKPALRYNKEDIFIAMNETVSAEVVNRCFGKLYECELDLLEMVRDQEIDVLF